jgi:hypothetical protein
MRRPKKKEGRVVETKRRLFASSDAGVGVRRERERERRWWRGREGKILSGAQTPGTHFACFTSTKVALLVKQARL